jgi:beta-glucanase (GH16 family)
MIGPSNLEDGKFHTYAVWWSAAFVKWYVDGKCVRALTANVPNVAQFLYFNQAADARSFDPIGTGTPLPATAVIESIDVWQE